MPTEQDPPDKPGEKSSEAEPNRKHKDKDKKKGK